LPAIAAAATRLRATRAGTNRWLPPRVVAEFVAALRNSRAITGAAVCEGGLDARARQARPPPRRQPAARLECDAGLPQEARSRLTVARDDKPNGDLALTPSR